MEFKRNPQNIPENLKAKEGIIFSNIEEIYNFHKA